MRLQAWYFYLHCPRKCQTSMSFPLGICGSRSFRGSGGHRELCPPDARAHRPSTSTSPFHVHTHLLKTPPGGACPLNPQRPFPAWSSPRRAVTPAPHSHGRRGKHTEHGTDTSPSSSSILGASTFPIPAWKDMNPSKQESVRPVPQSLGACLNSPGPRGWRGRKSLAVGSARSLEK